MNSLMSVVFIALVGVNVDQCNYMPTSNEVIQIKIS